jgi:PhnB protein
MQMTPYLNFEGNCREAFEFYRDVLNGEITGILTYGDSPMCDEIPSESHDQVMHAHLIADGAELMGSDGPPPEAGTKPSARVALNLDTAAEAERVYAAFSEGADVQMELQEMFWAERFAMLTDRFGTAWIINGNLKEER